MGNTSKATDGGGALLCGRYRIIEPIARGSQGHTSRALDEETGAFVAIKELDFAQLGQWEAVELFDREAAILAGLDHPSIPKIVDTFHVGDERHFMVQEFVEGDSLHQQLSAGRLVNEETLLDWADLLLEVLEYLHGFNPPIIHRDIKPANIIERPDGRLALVDFGAAHGAATSAGVIGTTGYMSPEQMMGMAAEASDLYSLGATLAHLATGRHPFELQTDGFRLDWQRFSRLSRRASQWIDRLVEPMPEDRLLSAHRARAELRIIRGDHARAESAAARDARGPSDAPSMGLVPANSPPGFVVQHRDDAIVIDIPDTHGSRLWRAVTFFLCVLLSYSTFYVFSVPDFVAIGSMFLPLAAFVSILTVPGTSKQVRSLELGRARAVLRLADGTSTDLRRRDTSPVVYGNRVDLQGARPEQRYAIARLSDVDQRKWMRDVLLTWRSSARPSE